MQVKILLWAEVMKRSRNGKILSQVGAALSKHRQNAAGDIPSSQSQSYCLVGKVLQPKRGGLVYSLKDGQLPKQEAYESRI